MNLDFLLYFIFFSSAIAKKNCYKKKNKCKRKEKCDKRKCYKEKKSDWYICADSSISDCKKKICESTARCIDSGFCDNSYRSSKCWKKDKCRRDKYPCEDSSSSRTSFPCRSEKKESDEQICLVAAIEEIIDHMAFESAEIVRCKKFAIQEAAKCAFENSNSALVFQIGLINDALVQRLTKILCDNQNINEEVIEIVVAANQAFSAAVDSAIQIESSRAEYQIKELSKLSDECILYEVKDLCDGLVKTITKDFEDAACLYKKEAAIIEAKELNDISAFLASVEGPLKDEVLSEVCLANQQILQSINATLCAASESLCRIIDVEFKELNLSLELLYCNVKRDLLFVVRQVDTGKTVVLPKPSYCRRDFANGAQPNVEAAVTRSS